MITKRNILFGIFFASKLCRSQTSTICVLLSPSIQHWTCEWLPDQVQTIHLFFTDLTRLHMQCIHFDFTLKLSPNFLARETVCICVSIPKCSNQPTRTTRQATNIRRSMYFSRIANASTAQSLKLRHIFVRSVGWKKYRFVRYRIYNQHTHSLLCKLIFQWM